MHPYAIDSEERSRIPLLVAMFAVAAAWAFAKFLAYSKLEIAWWIDAPSTMAFYGIFYQGFDRWLWKAKWLEMCGLRRAPVVAGRWQGWVTSSFDKHAEKRQVNVDISQRWSRMSISFRSAESRSESVAATVTTERAGQVVLTYEYRNEPLADAKETMQIHFGTARLYLDSPNVLDGDYYSGRGRETTGRVHLERAPIAGPA